MKKIKKIIREEMLKETLTPKASWKTAKKLAKGYGIDEGGAYVIYNTLDAIEDGADDQEAFEDAIENENLDRDKFTRINLVYIFDKEYGIDVF
jgi:hypothetical protein